MNVTEKLLNRAKEITGLSSITTNYAHTYGSLVKNITEYSKLLKEYKEYGINKMALIVKSNINFNTICLFYALIQNDIQPVIINEEIGEDIKGILEKERIDIIFFESIVKPNYLQKQNVSINSELGHFVTVRPYVNVKNKSKLNCLKWYLKVLKKEFKKTDCVCKLYDKVDNSIIEESITEKDMVRYYNEFNELYLYTAFTWLPLYKKEGILFLNAALQNDMHVVCFNQYDTQKNIRKIIEAKPDVIPVDMNMVLELTVNPKFRNLDLSFLKKVVVLVEPYYSILATERLEKVGFVGNYILSNPEKNEKTKKLK